MTPPRVSLQSIVRQFLQSLKEVVAIGAVELAAQHATVLETDGRNRRAWIVAAELLGQFLVPVHSAIAALDAGFGREPLLTLTRGLETRIGRGVSVSVSRYTSVNGFSRDWGRGL